MLSLMQAAAPFFIQAELAQTIDKNIKWCYSRSFFHNARLVHAGREQGSSP
jgi:hypothetical protein